MVLTVSLETTVSSTNGLRAETGVVKHVHIYRSLVNGLWSVHALLEMLPDRTSLSLRNDSGKERSATTSNLIIDSICLPNATGSV